MDDQSLKVAADKLRWKCDPDSLGFKSTKELKPSDAIIGQDRALNAIKAGLEINSPGYNIFVAGLTGTGKSTTVKTILEKIDRTSDIPDDICFTYNFDNPDIPHGLFIPAGWGNRLKNDMDDLVSDLLTRLPRLIESESFKDRKKHLMDQYNQKAIKLIGAFEENVRKEGLAVVQLQVGEITRPELMPLVQNEIVPWQQLEKMVADGKFEKSALKDLQKKHDRLSKELEKTLRENRKIEKQAQDALRELHNTFVQPYISGFIYELKEKYKDKKISAYLDRVETHMIHNLDAFTNQPDKAENNPLAAFMPVQKPDFIEYKINVFVDNSRLKRRPVVIETAANYKNLFGTIERVADRSGATYTDFTKIKAGSLVRANGGFLVLNLTDVLNEAGVWNALKRTLKNHKLDMQSYDPYYMFSQTALKPEAIDIDVKVVLIGDSYLYRLLYVHDEDFKKVFKIRADFDTVMVNNLKTINNYAQFVKKITHEEKLLPFDNKGVAEIIEHGVRLAGRQNKVSTRFSDVADVIREAHYWAKTEKKKNVSDEHVLKAISEKRKRSQMVEEKIQEMIDDGSIMIDVKGSKTGQVNGLAVYNGGDYSFGKPTRITATVGVGSAGIINIEREADLSGKTHNKGVLIIGGYFREKYAWDKALSFSASLAFEQSYSGVDGDSASSTEIYALLSALSSLPIRQDIAVTGSVNQKGEIQPIGGVNQKIEGFFDACKSRRLTGRQGVLIPHQNVNDLMLRKDVVDACSDGRFTVYAVKNIDRGIEILTGVKAGKKSRSGKYPADSVHYLVEKRLVELAELLHSKNKDKKKKNEEKPENESNKN